MVEARQNPNASRQDQAELQRNGTTLRINFREESNGEGLEGEYKRILGLNAFSIQIRVVVWAGENDTDTISVDANLFENGTKQDRFRL